MSKGKYQALDDGICAYISEGRGHPVNSGALEEIALPLVVSDKNPYPVVWRLIDRRMQAMRKAGRLRYVRRKGGGHGTWVAVVNVSAMDEPQ